LNIVVTLFQDFGLKLFLARRPRLPCLRSLSRRVLSLLSSQTALNFQPFWPDAVMSFDVDCGRKGLVNRVYNLGENRKKKK